ncbi:MAG: hypothetical protein N2517_03555 [Ignavibacteria bacterium]|nr:hypothetical protein [Ignavibacteria bacterium]
MKEKLASQTTNVERDITDILRILRELEVLGDWKKIGPLGGKYPIIWRNLLQFVKFR